MKTICYLEDLKKQQEALAAQLTSKNVEASSSELLNDLIPKVEDVYHSGQLNVIENTSTLKKSVSGSALLIDDISPVTHDMGVKVKGKNLIPYPYVVTTQTINGVTFTDNGDGSITVNGTATANAYYDLTRLNLYPKGDYFMSGCPAGGSTDSYYLNCVNASGIAYTLYKNDIGSGTIINLSSDDTLVFSIRIKSGTTVENLTFKPQLELGTTATAYTPYVPDLTAVKVIKSNSSGEAVADYTPTADGTVEGVSSLYPNTSLMTDTDGVLIDCEYYRDIYADDVITRTVTSYSNPKIKTIGDYAFYNCSALKIIDTPIATSIGNDAFNNCPSLSTINFPLTTSIGNNAFCNCTSLTTADFPVATSIEHDAFASCTSLTTADFPVATSIGNNAFCYCTALITLDFPLTASIGVSAFYNCSALIIVDFPAVTSISSSTFNNCSALTTADFLSVTNIRNQAFYNCKSLTAVILRSNTICALSNKNAFTGCTKITGTGGYIYVPSSLVDAYKTATNWVTYASKFRALEDYTVDGTTTGALDESKVSA